MGLRTVHPVGICPGSVVKGRSPVSSWYPTTPRLKTSVAGDRSRSPRSCSGEANAGESGLAPIPRVTVWSSSMACAMP